MKGMKLLSTSNTKLQKGEKFGYLSFGLSLAPHKLSGKNFCPHASAGCIAACLNTAGMGRFDSVQNARVKKSLFFLEDRAAFLAQLENEIAAAGRKAKKLGKKISVRLNVVSDLPWHKLIDMGKFPEIQFMDYTPNAQRMIDYLHGKLPANYHLTFSRKENNQAQVEVIAAMGGNVAVVFASMPEKYLGNPVIDGDESDLRFLDDKGVIVGLKAKGKARKDESGFVVK